MSTACRRMKQLFTRAGDVAQTLPCSIHARTHGHELSRAPFSRIDIPRRTLFHQQVVKKDIMRNIRHDLLFNYQRATWEWTRQEDNFDNIPSRVQEAWGVLGMTKDVWPTRNKVNPSKGNENDWVGLSAEQRQAAEFLGFTALTWRPKFLEHKNLQWEELDKASQEEWAKLGYNAHSWDLDELPEACKKDWVDLSPAHRTSALLLGYTPTTWDEDEEPFNWDFRRLLDIIPYALLVLGPLYMLFLKEDVRQTADKSEDQANAAGLWRVKMPPRENWQQACEALGFRFHSADGIKWTEGVRDTYWNEKGAYIVSKERAAEIDTAMFELHNMCLLAVERVVNDPALLDVFEIPASLRGAIQESWKVWARAREERGAGSRGGWC